MTKNSSFQRYKYNGKELDLTHGLNTYDYGARQYNLVVPTWDRIDQLAENKKLDDMIMKSKIETIEVNK